MTPAEAKQFWADLITAYGKERALAIAKAAPTILTPWSGTGEYFERSVYNEDTRPPGEVCKRGEVWAFSVDNVRVGWRDSCDEAKSACDARLRELGYLLEE